MKRLENKKNKKEIQTAVLHLENIKPIK